MEVECLDQRSSILIVDDEFDVCMNLKDIFAEFGFHVETAADGASALALVERSSFDVAVLDFKMPGMTGVELARRIRQVNSRTIAIIVSAYSTPETAETAFEAGVWKILHKPVDLPELLRVVEEATGRPFVLLPHEGGTPDPEQ